MMSVVPTSSPPRGDQEKSQLRHDRVVATVVVLLFAALMALMMWLASLGGGGVELDSDIWMMP